MQSFLCGLLGLLAAVAGAHAENSGSMTGGDSPPKRWKSVDGQELYEVRETANSLAFTRITPLADRMFGEFFTGTAYKIDGRFAGAASASVVQMIRGRASHVCTIPMTLTLSSVTDERIEGNVRAERIDPDCMPDNFSATMTAPAFTWIRATDNDTQSVLLVIPH